MNQHKSSGVQMVTLVAILALAADGSSLKPTLPHLKQSFRKVRKSCRCSSSQREYRGLSHRGRMRQAWAGSSTDASPFESVLVPPDPGKEARHTPPPIGQLGSYVGVHQR